MTDSQFFQMPDAGLSLAEFVPWGMHLLREWVDADVLSHAVIDVEHKMATTSVSPEVAPHSDYYATWPRLTSQDPVSSYWARASEFGRAVRTMDVIPSDIYRKLGVYENFLRPLGVRHQAIVLVRVRNAVVTCFGVNRDMRGFDDDEMDKLAALACQLGLVLDMTEKLEILHGGRRSFRRGLEWHQIEKIHVSATGQILNATEQALRWLLAYDFEMGYDCRLPRTLWQKLCTNRVATSSNARGRLCVSRMPGPGETSILLLEQYVQIDDEQIMAATQLTPAECGVLRLLLENPGQSNETVANARGTAVGTVRTQRNAIYEKLGVHRRGALHAEVEARLSFYLGNYQ